MIGMVTAGADGYCALVHCYSRRSFVLC